MNPPLLMLTLTLVDPDTLLDLPSPRNVTFIEPADAARLARDLAASPSAVKRHLASRITTALAHSTAPAPAAA